MIPAPLVAARTISRRHWIFAVSAATGLDLAARFTTTFDFGRVMHLEAVLRTLGVTLMTANIATLLAAVAGVVIWAIRRGQPTASA